MAAKPRKRAARKHGSPLPRRTRDQLTTLAARSGLPETEVLDRALSAYAAALGPDAKGPQTTIGRATQKAAAKAPRLFFSIEEGAEREARAPETIIGRDPGSDVRLDLPLIGPRHARLLVRDGRWIYEDLGTPRGSYRHGEPVQVAYVNDGDEIDLAGFLPIRFRLRP
jgi:hypothetical protein